MADILLNVGADLSQFNAALNTALNTPRPFRGLNANSFTEPLGRITGKSSEFQKSLEASNARVLAFGASAGAIYALQKSFTSLVQSTIDVQKTINELGVYLNSSSSSLKKFSNDLFDLAGKTGTSFQNAAKSATEFARQGLSMAETLERTKNALILARVSGMDFADSAKAITVALNGFKSEALSSVEVIDKITSADTAFAVSAGDLADALSRVGSSAEDANVTLSQTLALVTSAAQTTGRSGSVIGNAFKSIFTRLQRPKVLDDLEQVGIQTKNAAGQALPLIDVLKNLASTYDTLGSAQKSFVAESVGGVYQINTLKAVLSDLGSGFSVYDRALNIMATSAGTANARNEQLNQTLSAKLNETLQNFIQLGSKVGELTISPTIGGGFDAFSKLFKNLSTGLDGEGLAGDFGRGFLKGLGSIISGPGVQLITFTVLKLMQNLTVFAAKSYADFTGLNARAKQTEVIQAQILQELSQQPQIISQIRSGTISVEQATRQLFSSIERNNQALSAQLLLAQQIARAGVGAGMSAGLPKPRTIAGGYVPNFNDDFKREESLAKSYGASNPVAHYGKGTIGGQRFVMNSQETEIPNFGRNGDSAVIPTYSKGHIPNFAYKLGDFAGGIIKNPRAMAQFGKRGLNVEADDTISSIGYTKIAFPLSAAAKALRIKNPNGNEWKEQFEKDVLSKMQSFTAGFESKYGKTSAVDGFKFEPNIIKLLEVKAGNDWNDADVSNKFGRFIPENIGKLPQLLNYFKEGEVNKQDPINLLNYLAVPSAGSLSGIGKGGTSNLQDIEASRLAKKAKSNNRRIGAASGHFPNFEDRKISSELYEYPFRQMIRGRPRPVSAKEISAKSRDYELSLLKTGLPSLGFSDIEDLNKVFHPSWRADFFARKNSAPYILDAKAGYNDAKESKIFLKEDSMAELLKNPQFIQYLSAKGISDPNSVHKGFIFGNMQMQQRATLAKSGKLMAGGHIPNFAHYFYDSDLLAGTDKATIREAILANNTKKNLIHGPSGSGKTHNASTTGLLPILSMADIEKASEITLLSGSGKLSPMFLAQIDAVNRTGGSKKYLNVSDAQITAQRQSRLTNKYAHDTRSEAQLGHTAKAPLNDPAFIEQLYGLGFKNAFAAGNMPFGSFTSLNKSGLRGIMRDPSILKRYIDKDGTLRIPSTMSKDAVNLLGSLDKKDRLNILKSLGVKRIVGSTDPDVHASIGSHPTGYGTSFFGASAGGNYDRTLAAGHIPNFANVFNPGRHTSMGGTLSQANKPTAEGLQGLLNHIGIPYSGAMTKAGLSSLFSSKENKLKLYQFLLSDPIKVKDFPELHKEISDGNHRFELAKIAGIKNIPKMAGGYVPNFSDALSKAVGREMNAGYSSSQVKVGSDPSLISSMNPGGIGVYNSTEGSLGTGIALAKAAGINPKTKGMAGGHIPNFDVESSMGLGMMQFLMMMPAIQGAFDKLRGNAVATSQQLAELRIAVQNNQKQQVIQTSALKTAQAQYAAERTNFRTIRAASTGTPADVAAVEAARVQMGESANALRQARAQLTQTNQQATSQAEILAASTRRPSVGQLLTGSYTGAGEERIGIGRASISTGGLKNAGMGVAMAAPMLGNMLAEMLPVAADTKVALAGLGESAGLAGQAMSVLPPGVGAVVGGAILLNGVIQAAIKSIFGFSEKLKKGAEDSAKLTQAINTAADSLIQASNDYSSILNDNASSSKDILKAQQKYRDALRQMAASGMTQADMLKLAKAGSPKEKIEAAMDIKENQARRDASLQLLAATGDLQEAINNRGASGAGYGAAIGVGAAGLAAFGGLAMAGGAAAAATGIGIPVGVLIGAIGALTLAVAGVGAVIGYVVGKFGKNTNIFDVSYEGKGAGPSKLQQFSSQALASVAGKNYTIEEIKAENGKFINDIKQNYIKTLEEKSPYFAGGASSKAKELILISAQKAALDAKLAEMEEKTLDIRLYGLREEKKALESLQTSLRQAIKNFKVFEGDLANFNLGNLAERMKFGAKGMGYQSELNKNYAMGQAQNLPEGQRIIAEYQANLKAIGSEDVVSRIANQADVTSKLSGSISKFLEPLRSAGQIDLTGKDKTRQGAAEGSAYNTISKSLSDQLTPLLLQSTGGVDDARRIITDTLIGNQKAAKTRADSAGGEVAAFDAKNPVKGLTAEMEAQRKVLVDKQAVANAELATIGDMIKENTGNPILEAILGSINKNADISQKTAFDTLNETINAGNKLSQAIKERELGIGGGTSLIGDPSGQKKYLREIALARRREYSSNPDVAASGAATILKTNVANMIYSSKEQAQATDQYKMLLTQQRGFLRKQNIPGMDDTRIDKTARMQVDEAMGLNKIVNLADVQKLKDAGLAQIDAMKSLPEEVRNMMKTQISSGGDISGVMDQITKALDLKAQGEFKNAMEANTVALTALSTTGLKIDVAGIAALQALVEEQTKKLTELTITIDGEVNAVIENDPEISAMKATIMALAKRIDELEGIKTAASAPKTMLERVALGLRVGSAVASIPGVAGTAAGLAGIGAAATAK